MKADTSKLQESEPTHAVGEPTAAYGYHSQANAVEFYWERIKDANKDVKLSLIGRLSDSILDEMYDAPNAETMAAIEEARSGKYAGTIDMTNFDTFMNSINAIE